MKKTPLYAVHKALNARMAPFADYDMPIEYSGITDEHLAVRQSAGVFDVSHMGEIVVEGPSALSFLNYITTNNVATLYPGKAHYTCLPNGKGGIVDDLIIYCLEAEKYLCVVNASNVEKDYAWMKENNKQHKASLQNMSEFYAQLAVQGPKANEILQGLTTFNFTTLKPFEFAQAPLAGIQHVLIARTGYTGSGGYELYFDARNAETIWHALFGQKTNVALKPIGLGARDTLRLEAGYCLYGNDIDDTTSSIEAGLGWITKFTSDKLFIDKERLLQQKNNGVERKLAGFEMIDRGIPRQHYTIYDQAGNPMGEVTSGTMSPVLKKGIGLGYIKTSLSAPGQEIFIGIRDKKLKASVVKPPFIPLNS